MCRAVKLRLIHVSKICFPPKKTLVVEMAEYRVARLGQRLSTRSLGSCVGIILHDPYLKIGGLAHCMLPKPHKLVVRMGKYVSTAIPCMIRELQKKGSNLESLRAAVIGGAKIIRISEPVHGLNVLNVGASNVRAARRILTSRGIPIDIDDTGGTRGRNILFDPATGKVQVSYTRNVWPWRRQLWSFSAIQ